MFLEGRVHQLKFNETIDEIFQSFRTILYGISQHRKQGETSI